LVNKVGEGASVSVCPC